jgi:SAM-dependent methyltransferase
MALRLRDPGTQWDQRHAETGVQEPAPGDPALRAALAHLGPVAGRRLLDLGAGSGMASLFFAAHGAEVTSVDTSEVAVAALREHCAEHGIDRVTAVRASALDVAPLGPFDLVYGAMVLHHVEPFAAFVPVLREALAPGGRAFFFENNASPPLMFVRRHVVGRWGVPKYGDAAESPLGADEVDLLRAHFRVEVEFPELMLFVLASPYLLRRRAARPLWRLDRMLFHVPPLRRLSYRQYVKLA